MPAHVEPQHAEAALQQGRNLLGPAAAVGGQRMGDADGRRVLRADQIVGDTASLQRQQHGALSLEWRRGRTAARRRSLRDAPSRAVTSAAMPASAAAERAAAARPGRRRYARSCCGSSRRRRSPGRAARAPFLREKPQQRLVGAAVLGRCGDRRLQNRRPVGETGDAVDPVGPPARGQPNRHPHAARRRRERQAGSLRRRPGQCRTGSAAAGTSATGSG